MILASLIAIGAAIVALNLWTTYRNLRGDLADAGQGGKPVKAMRDADRLTVERREAPSGSACGADARPVNAPRQARQRMSGPAPQRDAGP